MRRSCSGGKLKENLATRASAFELIDDDLRITKEKRPTPTADSEFVWQRVEFQAKKFIVEQIKKGDIDVKDIRDHDRDFDLDLGAEPSQDFIDEVGNDEDDRDLDFLFILVARDHLAMSVLTKFSLIMQYFDCGVGAFFHSFTLILAFFTLRAWLCCNSIRGASQCLKKFFAMLLATSWSPSEIPQGFSSRRQGQGSRSRDNFNGVKGIQPRTLNL